MSKISFQNKRISYIISFELQKAVLLLFIHFYSQGTLLKKHTKRRIAKEGGIVAIKWINAYIALT